MKSFIFSWQPTAGLDAADLKKCESRLNPVIKKLQEAQKAGYQSEFSSINLPSDQIYFNEITQLVKQKQQLQPQLIVIIGIGGSSLGTRAIWQATQPYHNQQASDLLFAETIDPDLIATQVAHIEQVLIQKKPVLLVVISKSGTTTETIANFVIFKQVLEKYYAANVHEHIVAITDKDSQLWHYANKHKYSVLPIPATVGGRFSVFSAVGLFPLAMAGLDIATLLQGAASVIDICLQTDITKNYAALNAGFLEYYYQRAIAISDLFLFSTYLNDLGAWYRQLIAESLGKRRTSQGSAPVRVGITPTVSIGTTDLHSMVQLYLAGPIARTTTFVTVQKYHNTIALPEQSKEINPILAHKSLETIMQAIIGGVQTAYQKEKLPFITIALPDTSLYSVGQFMQHAMITTMYTGALLEIATFDQPQVELYKTETQRILGS